MTRKNIHVDRITSAWLVRRFIDPKAEFKFVPAQGYRARPDEVTFDMFEATFTHEGDKCTFEVLLDACDLREPGLRAIAEIVHDIAGIALCERDDASRLAFGERVFGALLEAVRRRSSR